MQNLVTPPPETDHTRRLVFWLAMEEWASRNASDSFFIWSSRPTVIFGHNQDMEAEVNVPYCREHGIEMYRRKSGGGCVYSDEGCLMLSFITRDTNVNRAFSTYLERLASALRELGFESAITQNNDVLVCGRKVSGNACYATPKGCVIHGTLLYDTDFSVLEKAITPSAVKLESHHVKSVRQRVANLKEFGTDLSSDALKSKLIYYFCNNIQSTLTEAEMSQVCEIENSYLDENFIRYGRNH